MSEDSPRAQSAFAYARFLSRDAGDCIVPAGNASTCEITVTGDLIVGNVTLLGWNGVLQFGQTRTIDGPLKATDDPGVLSNYGSNLSLVGQNMATRNLTGLDLMDLLVSEMWVETYTLPQTLASQFCDQDWIFPMHMQH